MQHRIQQQIQQCVQRDQRSQCTDDRHHAACLEEEQPVLAAVFFKMFGLDSAAALVAPHAGVFHDRVTVEHHHQTASELKSKKHGLYLVWSLSFRAGNHLELPPLCSGNRRGNFILICNSGKSADFPELPLHERGRYGQRHFRSKRLFTEGVAAASSSKCNQPERPFL